MHRFIYLLVSKIIVFMACTSFSRARFWSREHIDNYVIYGIICFENFHSCHIHWHGIMVRAIKTM